MGKHWIAILGGIEIIAGGLVNLFPSLPSWISWALVLIGFCTVVYGIRGAMAARTTAPANMHQHGWVSTWNVSFKADDWWPFRRLISLSVAADKGMRQTDLAADAARSLDINPKAWMATAITQDGDIPIFGYRDEWSRLTEIPHKEFNSGTISEDCNALVRYGEDKPRYVGLRLKARDFRKRLAEIKKWKL